MMLNVPTVVSVVVTTVDSTKKRYYSTSNSGICFRLFCHPPILLIISGKGWPKCGKRSSSISPCITTVGTGLPNFQPIDISIYYTISGSVYVVSSGPSWSNCLPF